MNDALSGFLSTSLFDGIIQDMVLFHVGIAELLSGAFLLIAIIWNFGVHFLRSKGREILEYQETGRIFVMMFIIPLYIPLMYLPIKITNLIDDATAPSMAELADYGEKTKITLQDGGLVAQLSDEASNDPDIVSDVVDENERAETNKEITVWDYLGGALSPNMIGTFVLDMITVTLGSIIKILIVAMLKVLGIIFYVIGPFAWAFSVLPIWKDKIVVWFNTFATILFAKIIYNIFDRILYANLFKDVVEGGILGKFETGYQSLLINLVLVVLYIMPFWVAGKVIGSSDAGRFLSMTTQMATTAISSGMSGMLGGGSLAKIAGVGKKDSITN